MDLQAHIRPDLWSAIQSTYQAGNYSQAILAATHYVSDVLREKTGVDGDGPSLVGQALGGDAPRLKLNKLQTITEKDEQRGVQNILKGIYEAIRNPRSHEQAQDKKDTADAIIYFIDYLIGLLDQSEEPFTIAGFLESVFDPAFVDDESYIGLLVAEIPANKVYDTLVSLYRVKTTGEITHIRKVIRQLLTRLPQQQMGQYLAVVGDEMRRITEFDDVKCSVATLPAALWSQLPDIPKIRIENMILKDLKEGRRNRNGKVLGGALATWARQHLPYFRQVNDVRSILKAKLLSQDKDEMRYVFGFFFSTLPAISDTDENDIWAYNMTHYIKAIAGLVREGDLEVREELINNVNSLPMNWMTAFTEELADLTDKENPAIYLASGVEFLTELPPSEMHDEDIPF